MYFIIIGPYLNIPFKITHTIFFLFSGEFTFLKAQHKTTYLICLIQVHFGTEPDLIDLSD